MAEQFYVKGKGDHLVCVDVNSTPFRKMLSVEAHDISLTRLVNAAEKEYPDHAVDDAWTEEGYHIVSLGLVVAMDPDMAMLQMRELASGNW